MAAQGAAAHLGCYRMFAAVLDGLKTTARSFGRVLHLLWLEVTGFTFLALAAIGALAGLREYSKYEGGRAAGPGRLIVAICFTATFAWFGLSSFWRARRGIPNRGLKERERA